jgi:hypothetical protein
VSQNLAAAAMLLRGCPEPATSEERRVREQLKALLEAAVAQQAESSTSRQCSERGRAGVPSAHGPNPPPPQQQEQGDGVRAAASAVKSRLGPHRDARHTIEARRRAKSVDNNDDNFQGTYMRPGKQWELRNCKQQHGESLREYIRLFSKRCTEVPGATDNDALSVFQNGTMCTSLIHRFGRHMPRTTRELLDIASNHAGGEEALAVTLNTPQGKGK